MILFVNVYLQEFSGSPLGYSNSRYNLKEFTKVEVFLYTLESYKVINWSNVIIYCELDSNVEDHDTVYSKILDIFPRAIIYKIRNAHQLDWQKAIKKLDDFDDDLIWYAGNHDHPYLAPNNNQLDLLIEALNNCQEHYKAAVYSHPQDNASWIMECPVFKWQHESKGICSYRARRAEGIMIVNKALFKSWWFDFNYGDAFIPRADWIDVSCSSPETKIFLPIKPLCHHFDGYTFVSYMYDTNDVPPLEIPEGFWDYRIIIDFCGIDKKEGHTLVNPFLPFAARHDNGADLRCGLEDLPLFWRNRIAKITDNSLNYKRVRNARNRALYEAMAARRLDNNKMMQKGVNWSELKNYRPKLSLKFLKDLFS